MDEFSEKIGVCGKGSCIESIILSCQDFNGQPEFEVGIAEAVKIEPSLIVGVDGQAVEVSEDHAAHWAAEEILDVVGLASVDGGIQSSEGIDVVVSNGVDVKVME